MKPELTDELKERLEGGEFEGLRPFGMELTEALKKAHWDAEKDEAVWEEEDYCSPPLAQEREAVLDQYFEDIRVEPVSQEQGWTRIASFPSLWEK